MSCCATVANSSETGTKKSEAAEPAVQQPEPLVRDESLRKTGSVREWDRGKKPVYGNSLQLWRCLSCLLSAALIRLCIVRDIWHCTNLFWLIDWYWCLAHGNDRLPVCEVLLQWIMVTCHSLRWSNQGAHITVKMLFRDFPRTVLCAFSRTIHVHFPRLSRTI